MIKATTIRAKDETVFENLFEVGWHPNLIEIYRWINSALLDPMPVITSAYRAGDKGVHGTSPLRAFDLRSHGLDGKFIERAINEYCKYDFMRPDMGCCLYHNSGSGMHFHVQVHENTEFTNWAITMRPKSATKKGSHIH